MVVAFFTNNYCPRISGVAVSVSSLKKALEEKGAKVFVFAPSYGYISKEEESGVYRVNSIRFWWLKRFAFPIPFINIRRIKKIISEIKPDIIHIHHPFLLGRAGLRLGKEFNIPVVFTYHTLYEKYAHYFLIKERLGKKLARWSALDCADKCSLVIAPTENICNYLKRKGIKTKLSVVPTGIDFDLFNRRVSLIKLAEFKIKTGVPDGKKILLYVGRIAKEKNIKFLLKALRRVLKKEKDLVLIIAGDGVYSKMSRRLAKIYHIDKNIIWAGPVRRHDLPLYYQTADLFVFPSVTDTQAIVLYEALACGLPIIAIDSMASRAIVKDGENGLIVSKNMARFSDAVIKNLNLKKDKFIALNENDYSLPRMAETILGIYRNVLDGALLINQPAVQFRQAENKFAVRLIPNLITLFRLCLSLPIIISILNRRLSQAVLLILLFIILDKLDGVTARKLDGVTKFGRYLDSFTDKFTFLAAFGAAFIAGLLPGWAVLVIVFINIIQIYLAIIALFVLKIRKLPVTHIPIAVGVALALGVFLSNPYQSILFSLAVVLGVNHVYYYAEEIFPNIVKKAISLKTAIMGYAKNIPFMKNVFGYISVKIKQRGEENCQKIYTTANAVTGLRIILIGFIIYFYLNGAIAACVVLLMVFFAGDFIDGALARKLHQAGRLGKILDAVADKTLILAFLIVWAATGLLPSWLFWLLIIRIVSVSGIATYMFFIAKKPLPIAYFSFLSSISLLACLIWKSDILLIFVVIFNWQTLVNYALQASNYPGALNENAASSIIVTK